MLKQLLKQKWYIVSILILIILEPSVNSVLNFWLQTLFNSATPGADKVDVMRLLTFGFFLWMLKRIVSFSSGVVKNRFICNAKQEVKHNLFKCLIGLDTSTVSNLASSGEYISIFTNDITIIETRFYNQVVGLISSLFSIIILGSSFFALNVKLAVAILSFGIITMFVPVVFSKKLNEKNLIYSSFISKFTQRIKEYMVAYPTIKNYSIESIIVKKFNLLNQQVEDSKFEAEYSLTLANNIGQLLAWFLQFIGVGFGLMLVIQGEIMIGTVIAAQSFASDLGTPLQNVIISINSIKSVKQIVSKLDKFSNIPNVEGKKTKADADDTKLDNYNVQFDNFSLSIDEKTIIDHFSFNFESGKKYLVVGLNGAGKSTIFKTLKKWYKVSSGRITVGNRDISSIDNKMLSKYISYLNENVSLFSGSVRENISLFRQFSDEKFKHAVNSAKIEIDLDREVSDEGRNISSGEQRRIEIARSLMEAVKVLIFDEVVSTLDIETAYEIEKMALSLSEKTIIFISHNFSGKLIKDYDEILVMGEGKLISHGSYEYLISSCEYFRRICEIKFGNQY